MPRMLPCHRALAAAIRLGVLWGLRHLPVVDSLGAASPHGEYWFPFLFAFVAIRTARRVLMVWVYRNTGSVLLAQLMHASSTGSLVVFGPVHITPAQGALWYGLYGVTLWLVVAVLVTVIGKDLGR